MLYYLVFFLGLLSGLLLRQPWLFRFAHGTMLGSGYVLIALFGYQMGSSPLLGISLLSDLVSAAVLACAAAAGSVACSFLFVWTVRKMSASKESVPTDALSSNDEDMGQAMSVWRPVIRSLTLLVAGVVSGLFLPVVPVDTPIRFFLLLMIVAVGVQSAQEVCMLMRGGLQGSSATCSSLVLLFALPVAVIAGTLLFCAAAGLFLPYRWTDCMLCGAPMGWQTLGGPMVQELRGLPLGNVAFLTNMFRDVVALVMIPLVSRNRYALLGVTPGGVSSMDILLPGIIAAAGRHNLIYALWVGASCSFWAPILIYLIAKVC